MAPGSKPFSEKQALFRFRFFDDKEGETDERKRKQESK
jgi:hypothetical protein